MIVINTLINSLIIKRGFYLMVISLNVPHKLNDNIDILLDRIPYLSEIVVGVSYNKTDKVVNLTVNESDQNAALIVELKQYYEDLCKSLENTRVIKERIVKSNLDVNNNLLIKNENEDNISPSPYMFETDIKIIEQLDKEFLEIARKHGTELREYSSILSKSNILRNQYHIHFPQNIYGVASVAHNFKSINRFREKAIAESYDDSLLFQGDILQPCICYHCYEELQGKVLSDGITLTAKGKCFRHEIEWRKDNFRRSEFTMREIVFIGREEWVRETRNRIMEDVWNLFESVGLKGEITTAKDPFFFSQDLKTKGTYQMMSNAKYELIVSTLSGKKFLLLPSIIAKICFVLNMR